MKEGCKMGREYKELPLVEEWYTDANELFKKTKPKEKQGDKMVNEVTKPLPILLLILICISSFSICILSSVSTINNEKQIQLNNSLKCKDLGYDNYKDNKCFKVLDYNKKQGNYDNCYMPLKVNFSANVWCKE